MTVSNPRAPDAVFTDEGAWDFVATALENGAEVNVIVLRKPDGKKGYTMLLEGHGPMKIYVKLQLGSDHVIGRSFHESKVQE